MHQNYFSLVKYVTAVFLRLAPEATFLALLHYCTV
jgi:hypothetical protein